MSGMTIAVPLALAFGAILLWLLRPRQRHLETVQPTIDQKMGSVLPKHYRYFPQIRRALSAADNTYLRDVAPPHIAQHVLRERRAIARRFLHGLHEDFSGLERLARMVASLSPVISREQETERLYLGFRFRMFYALVWLRLFTGRVPLRQIEHLTELVGRLALRMDEAMVEIGALSADQLSRGINA